MRNAFINEILDLAAVHDHIALVVGDLGYSVVEPFADAFPGRFVNAGVAEQNMAGIAAGMASEGYHVFTYSIANFPTFRCAEQIRNDIDYHRLAVTIVAVGGGLAYGALGYSHHAVQDYALLRTMPNMLIAAPGDPMETRACLRYLIKHPQPSYLRLGKSGEPEFHAAIPAVVPGRWTAVGDQQETEGGKCLLATGGALGAAARKRQQPEFRDHKLYSLPLWSMATKPDQADQFSRFEEVTTLEDHLIDGGFGSWMLEALRNDPALLGRVRTIALSENVCGTVGSQAALNIFGGLV